MNCLTNIDNTNNTLYINTSNSLLNNSITSYFLDTFGNINISLRNITEYIELKTIYKTILLCCHRNSIKYNMDSILYIFSYFSLADFPISNSKINFIYIISDIQAKRNTFSFDKSLFSPQQFFLKIELRIIQNNKTKYELLIECQSTIVENFSKNDFVFPIIWNYKENKIHSINNSESLGIIKNMGMFYPYFILKNFFIDVKINY